LRSVPLGLPRESWTKLDWESVLRQAFLVGNNKGKQVEAKIIGSFQNHIQDFPGKQGGLCIYVPESLPEKQRFKNAHSESEYSIGNWTPKPGAF
jgi:hypothetical protein